VSRAGWRPPDVVELSPLDKGDDLSQFKKYDTRVPSALKVHCVIQYVTTAIIGVSLMLSYTSLSLSEHLIVVSFALVSSFSIGALMENKVYSGTLEWARLCVLLVTASILPLWQTLSVFLVLSVLSCLPFLWIGRRDAIRQQSLVSL